MVALGSNRSCNSGLAVEAIFSVEAMIALGTYCAGVTLGSNRSGNTRLAVEAIFTGQAMIALGSYRSSRPVGAITSTRPSSAAGSQKESFGPA